MAYEHKNKALIVDYTETWCPTCGSYGGPTLDDLVTNKECTSASVIKACQASLPVSFNSPISAGWFTDRVCPAWPTFGINADVFGPISMNINSNVNYINTKINTFAGQPNVADVALMKSISGTTMTVTTKVKFYTAQAASKDIRLAVYVLEDNLIANQQMDGAPDEPNYLHRNLLRAGNASTYKGASLNTSAAIAANQEFEKTYSITLNSAWKTANLKVVAVIYDATATGLPIVINSNEIK